MTYRFDRDELFSLAAWLRRLGGEVGSTQQGLQSALAAVGRSSRAATALSQTVDSCSHRASDLAERAWALDGLSRVGWRLAERRADELLSVWTGILRFAGSDNDPRLDAMLRLSTDLESGFLRSLPGLVPSQVAMVAAGLPSEVGRRLAWSSPYVIANTDGLPLSWRAEATRRLMQAEADRLRRHVNVSPEQASNPVTADRLQLLDGWLASDRTFIQFDPAGDGTLVEVVGDYEAAEAVGVFVPGMGSDLVTFEAVASHARGLVAAASTMERQVAMVAWLGYDAPAGVGLNLDAVFAGHAERGAPQLARFVDGLAAQRPSVPLTVVAHSYGSVVAGWAAAFDHLHADRLVIVGSPNVAPAHASLLAIPQSAGVFVGEAPYDPVVAIGEVTDGWRDDWSGLGHGYNPGDCDWGAVVFDVQDVGWIEAHVAYSSGQSAQAIVKVMVGEESEVVDRCD